MGKNFCENLSSNVVVDRVEELRRGLILMCSLFPPLITVILRQELKRKKKRDCAEIVQINGKHALLLIFLVKKKIHSRDVLTLQIVIVGYR